MQTRGLAVFASSILILFLSLTPLSAQISVSNSSQYQKLYEEKQSVIQKLAFLQSRLTEKSDSPKTSVRLLLATVEKNAATLEQHLALLESIKKKEQALHKEVGWDGFLAGIRVDLAPDSFKYLQRLEWTLFSLDERAQDMRVAVDTTQSMLRGVNQEIADLERRFRKQNDSVSKQAAGTGDTFELIQAQRAATRARKEFYETQLQISQQEYKQHEKEFEVIEQEIKEVQKKTSPAESDKTELLNDFNEKLEKTVATGKQIDTSLARLEQQVNRTAVTEQVRARLVEQIQEVRLVLQQSLLSTTQLSEAYAEYITLTYKLYNNALSSEELKAGRASLAHTLELLHGIGSWNERKFSLLVNQLAGIYTTEDGAIAQAVRSEIDRLTGIIAEQRELVRYGTWSIRRFLAETTTGFDVRAGVSHFWDFLKTLWQFELLVVDDHPITLAKIVGSFLIFILGWIVARYVTSKLLAGLLGRISHSVGVSAAIQSIAFYVLLGCFALLALHLVHIPLTVFTLLGGALAIGVGFGSQNILNNFISGLILLFEQPIRAGDIVEFAGTRGTVKRIGARSTLLVTPENIEVVVPNSHLLENSVMNFTLDDSLVRRSVAVGVAYGSPTREVAKLLLKAAGEHGKIHKKPAPNVFFKDFGDSALIFEVRFWVTINQYSDALKVESDMRHIIDQLFREAGIVIAFPQRDLHLFTSEAPIRVTVSSVEDSSLPEDKRAATQHVARDDE